MNVLYYIGSWFFFVLCLSCAEPAAPVGGPKDVTPPAISSKKYSTPNGITSFSYDKVIVTFDEWVRTVNPTQQVIITPPLATKPEIFVRNKSVIVRWDEDLRPNTTYSIQFGDAIVDITEGNTAKNIKRVFSTGPFIDSCTFSGVVMDYFEDMPIKDATILLYDTSNTDILKTRPYYFSTSTSGGQFNIDYIKNGAYRVAAVVDANNNYLFDKEDEKIAFKKIILQITEKPSNDTLYLYEERQSTRILSYDYKPPRLHIEFNNSDMIGTFTCSSDQNKNILIRSYQDSDSLNIWHSPEVNYPIQFVISNPDESFIDTFTIKEKTFRSDAIDSLCILYGESLIEPISYLRNNQSGFQTIFPITTIDQDKLYIKYDESERSIFAQIDNVDPTKAVLKMDSLPADSFKVVILPNAIQDIRSTSNSDTIILYFKEKDTATLGNLEIISEELDSTQSYILLVHKDNELIVIESINKVRQSRWVSVVDPGTYRIRLVTDLNKNGRWDSGNLSQQKLPEPLRVSKELTVKAGWENEFLITPN